VAQFVENIKREKIDYIADEKITELRQQFHEINRGDSVPLESIQAFAENLNKAIESVPDDCLKSNGEDEETEELDEATSPPDPKRIRTDSNKSSSSSTPRPNELNQQLMASMMGFPLMSNNGAGTSHFMSPEMLQAALASMVPGAFSDASQNANDSSLNGSSPQKRARTRITDDQLKILRQYFDINNSPTEQQVKEMSLKAGLPEKVIKHWFRNTLFKERQRDKNSPYNFSVPAMMSIDLDTYEKTGEAKIIPLKQDEKKESFCDESKVIASSSLLDSDQNDNRATSPSNSSTHSSSAATNSGPSAADFMANFNKAMAAAAMFNNNPDFASQNPFAAFFATAGSEESNPFTHLFNGLNSTATSMSTPTTPKHNPPSIASNSANLSASGSSRRANRTRFTDFQLRTLQDFFDKQAYPKDDDLEMLSKKLSLSPRVIG
jgi:AT-binding transcription factor 1